MKLDVTLFSCVSFKFWMFPNGRDCVLFCPSYLLAFKHLLRLFIFCILFCPLVVFKFTHAMSRMIFYTIMGTWFGAFFSNSYNAKKTIAWTRTSTQNMHGGQISRTVQSLQALMFACKTSNVAACNLAFAAIAQLKIKADGAILNVIFLG